MGHVSGSIGGLSARALDGGLAQRGFAAPTVRQLSAANLTRWTAARGRALAMGGLAKINLIGDSTQGLVGSGSGGSWTDGGFPRSLAAQLVRLLNARAGRADFARCDGYWGNHFSTAGSQNTFLAYDSRWSWSGGTFGGDSVYLAGGSILSPAGQTGTLTLSGIAQPYDRVRLIGRRVTSGGVVTVASASGGSGTFTLTGGTAVIETTINVTRGTGNLTLSFDSGYDAIIAVEIWDSSVGQVIVRDLAYSGSYTGTSTAGWLAAGPTAALPFVTADFVLYCFGLNDASYGVTAADYVANLQTLAARNGGVGSIALTVENESSAGWNSTATLTAQRAIAAAVRTLGAEAGWPAIDVPARWGDYVAANGNGLHANDPHPNAAGYADKAVALMGLLWV